MRQPTIKARAIGAKRGELELYWPGTDDAWRWLRYLLWPIPSPVSPIGAPVVMVPWLRLENRAAEKAIDAYEREHARPPRRIIMRGYSIGGVKAAYAYAALRERHPEYDCKLEIAGAPACAWRFPLWRLVYRIAWRLFGKRTHRIAPPNEPTLLRCRQGVHHIVRGDPVPLLALPWYRHLGAVKHHGNRRMPHPRHHHESAYREHEVDLGGGID